MANRGPFWRSIERDRRRNSRDIIVFSVISACLLVLILRPEIVYYGLKAVTDAVSEQMLGQLSQVRQQAQNRSAPTAPGATPPVTYMPPEQIVLRRRQDLIGRLARVISVQQNCAQAYEIMVPAFRSYVPSPAAEGIAARQARAVVAGCGGARAQLADLKAAFTRELQSPRAGPQIVFVNGQRRTLPADDGPALAIGVAQAFIATAAARELAAADVIHLLNQAGGPPPGMIMARLARADQEGFAAQNQLGQVMGARSITPQELAAAR